MFSFALDIVGGYFIAKFVRNIWFGILLAVVIGVSSSVVANLLMYAFNPDIFTSREIGIRIATGIPFHQVFTVVAFLIFRRKILNKTKTEASSGDNQK